MTNRDTRVLQCGKCGVTAIASVLWTEPVDARLTLRHKKTRSGLRHELVVYQATGKPRTIDGGFIVPA